MWQNIAASETDANSPLNQTLLDKVRGNLDHLRGIGASMKFITTRFANTDPGVDLVLDEGQDWRDRYVQALGTVFQGTNNDCDEVELGGSKDIKIGSPYVTAPLNLRQAHFNGWIYTSGGNSVRTDDPRLWAEDPAGDPDLYLWVRSSDGKLMLGAVTGRTSDYRNLVCHLRLTWSENMGGH